MALKISACATTSAARHFCACLLLIASTSTPTGAHAEAVAMIADLVGGGCTLSGATPGPCEILGYLEPGSTLRLTKGARATVVFFGSGREYVVAGPGETRIDATAPTTLAGNVPQGRELALARDTGLEASDVRGHKQAALILRGFSKRKKKLRLHTPRNTGVIDPHPTFEWAALEPGVQYRFALSDQAGRMVLQTLVNTNRFTLPSEITLTEATLYTWQVDTRLADGTTFSSSADFTLLEQSQRRALERVRPAADAPVSELVLYAVLLEREGVRGAAKRWWALAAERRPGDEVLRGKTGK